jgi:sulfotransferase
MDKTYYFLAGLPRSGNTLLSAILNQNPDIYSSPLSPVGEYINKLSTMHNSIEQVNRNKENIDRSEELIKNLIKNFYNGVDKKHIIDRGKMWGSPEYLNNIKQYITPTPKIIFTVRDILEILSSFILLDETFLQKQAFEKNHLSFSYRSVMDVYCDSYMELDGRMDQVLNSLGSAFIPENEGIFHIVEYNDLVLHPEETMSKIYKFLEIDNYHHNFDEIQKVETDDDIGLGLPKDLHLIRSTLSKSLNNTDILSSYIRDKYCNLEFWREDSKIKIRGRDF